MCVRVRVNIHVSQCVCISTLECKQACVKMSARIRMNVSVYMCDECACVCV